MLIDEAIAHARDNYNDIINTTYNKCQSEHLSCECCATPTCKEIADENLHIAEWLEELKFIRQWKSDIMDDFCKYDVSSFEELVTNVRNKAIDDIKEKLMQNGFIYTQLALDVFNEIAEQLKAGGTNDEQ